MGDHSSHRNSTGRRIRYWFRKHRMMVGAFALIILCGFGILGYGMYRRQAENRDSYSAAQYTVEDANTLHEITAVQDDSGEVFYTMDGKEMPDRPYFFAGHRIRYNGEEYRRNTAVKGYLIMGVDSRGSLKDVSSIEDVRLADAQVLVVHNTAKDTVQLIEIPRDTMTWVYRTDENSQIIDREYNHINTAWNYGDGHELSGQYASQAVVWLMGGLPVDGYLATGMDSINLLNDLRSQMGLTILFIAHNLSVVKYFSDRIAVMYFGKIVEMADSDELFLHPLHPYTKSLLSAIPYPDPNYEKRRKRIEYHPETAHDYSVQGPTLREILPGHFILCNDAELEAYRREIAEDDAARGSEAV